MRRKFSLPAGLPCGEIAFSQNRSWLAPLAGYSDLPFRILCREHGASVCETEMVSAKGLLYKSPGSDALLRSTPADQPLIVQLFGSEPETMAQAVLLLRRHGYTAFDCNLGCPVRKVMRQGAGAALLSEPAKCLAIAKAMLAAGREEIENLPPARMGFKFRLPPDGRMGSAASLGRMLEDCGADWLALHPRTAAQGYGGKANWHEISLLAKAVAIPVIASGDLMTASDGNRCLGETGAASVMYGRGALRNPFIFRQHLALLNGGDCPGQTAQGLVALARRHIELTRLHFGDGRALAKIRSILPRYVRDFAGVNSLRLRLSQCDDWDRLAIILQEFLELT